MFMKIREATEQDFEKIWPIFNEIVLAGDTYGYAVDTLKQDALNLWIQIPRKTFVYEDNNNILGTYYIKSNQNGPGKHVCNCGYMVASSARGKGIATIMCEHSQKIALQFGYQAMQFNFVASSNRQAVKLWNKLGFEIIGRIPKGFNHPKQGLVDALIMYKWLI